MILNSGLLYTLEKKRFSIYHFIIILYALRGSRTAKRQNEWLNRIAGLLHLFSRTSLCNEKKLETNFFINAENVLLRMLQQ